MYLGISLQKNMKILIFTIIFLLLFLEISLAGCCSKYCCWKDCDEGWKIVCCSKGAKCVKEEYVAKCKDGYVVWTYYTSSENPIFGEKWHYEENIILRGEADYSYGYVTTCELKSEFKKDREGRYLYVIICAKGWKPCENNTHATCYNPNYNEVCVNGKIKKGWKSSCSKDSECASNWCVNGKCALSPYESLQNAIKSASSGETIYLGEGTWNERVIISKPITLIGKGKDKTIIFHNAEKDSKKCECATGIGLEIKSSNVIIKNLKIYGRGSDGKKDTWWYECKCGAKPGYGVIISSGENIIFENVSIIGKGGTGYETKNRGGDGYGLFIKGGGNIYFKNCNIIGDGGDYTTDEGSTKGGGSGYGVYIIKGKNITFESNSIKAGSPLSAKGIGIYTKVSLNLTKNTIYVGATTHHDIFGIKVDNGNLWMKQNSIRIYAATCKESSKGCSWRESYNRYGIYLKKGEHILIKNSLYIEGGHGRCTPQGETKGGTAFGIWAKNVKLILLNNSISGIGGRGGVCEGYDTRFGIAGGDGYGLYLENVRGKIMYNTIQGKGGTGTGMCKSICGNGGKGYGIYLLSSPNLEISNNKIIGKGGETEEPDGGEGGYGYGIYIKNSFKRLTNNIIIAKGGKNGGSKYCNSKGGDAYGIYLENIYSKIISNLKIEVNQDFWGSLGDCCADGGKAYGIYLKNVYNSEFNDLIVKVRGGTSSCNYRDKTVKNGGDAYGIYLDGSSSNEFKGIDMYVEGGSRQGWYVPSYYSVGKAYILYFHSSSNNLFYNNKFYGRDGKAESWGSGVNIDFNPIIRIHNPSGNYFYVSPYSGINIIGTDKIGGNYWGEFSKTCQNSEEPYAFCDNPYTIAHGIQDKYPLAHVYISETGRINLTLKANDAGSGIASIKVYLDGNIYKECETSPCIIELYPSKGWHTFYVNVTDGVGNSVVTPTKAIYVKNPCCKDECSLGEIKCEGGTTIKKCDNWDLDPCTEWGEIETCEDTCSDSDGGINIAEKGTVIDNDLCSSGDTSCPSSTYTDYCIDEETIREYYCSGNDYNYKDLYIGNGYICRDGKQKEALSIVASISSFSIAANDVTSFKLIVKNLLNEKRDIRIYFPKVYNSTTDRRLEEYDSIVEEISYQGRDVKGEVLTFEPNEEKEFEVIIATPPTIREGKYKIKFAVKSTKPGETKGAYNETFVEMNVNVVLIPIEINARAYDSRGNPVANTLVKAYVCPVNVEFCDKANALFGNEGYTNSTGHFTLTINAFLELGKKYKVAVVTERGYAESIIET